jgi:hypothetical protein
VQAWRSRPCRAADAHARERRHSSPKPTAYL